MAINIPIITDFDARGLKQAMKAFDGLKAQTSKIGQSIKRTFMIGAAAVTGLAAAGFSAIKAAAEDQKAQALLARQLRTTTKATDDQISAVEKQISTLALATGVADDELRPAFASLVRSTRNTTKAQKALRIALNVSRATGRPLIKVAEALSRAYGGNVKALARLDPSLKELITKTTTADQAVGYLARNFEGAAATAAETLQGRVDRASVAFGEMKEAIGVALLPVAEKLTAFFTDKLIPYAQDVADAYGEDGLRGVFQKLSEDLSTATEDNKGLSDGLLNLLATAAIVGGGLKGIVEFGQFLATIKSMKDNVGLLGGAFVALKTVSLPFLISAMALGVAAVYTLVEAMRDKFFRSTFGEYLLNIGRTVFNVFVGIYKIARAVLNPIIAVLRQLPFIGGKFGYLPDVDFKQTTDYARGPSFSNPREFESSPYNEVTINVNGGDPQSVVDALVTWTRQNGSLPITVR